MRSFYVLDEESIVDETIGQINVVTAGGELDYAACPRLRALLIEAVKSGHTAVLVDMTSADFIDSTAIGVLVSAAAKLEDLDRRLVIACDEDQILNIFGIVGLDEIVDIYASREQAVEGITSIA
ncbi:MAG TPA: STAS domain-containing protein [Solirubrobacteraceae bacterium]